MFLCISQRWLTAQRHTCGIFGMPCLDCGRIAMGHRQSEDMDFIGITKPPADPPMRGYLPFYLDLVLNVARSHTMCVHTRHRDNQPVAISIHTPPTCILHLGLPVRIGPAAGHFSVRCTQLSHLRKHSLIHWGEGGRCLAKRHALSSLPNAPGTLPDLAAFGEYLKWYSCKTYLLLHHCSATRVALDEN